MRRRERDALRFVIVAEDVSDNSLDKLVPLLERAADSVRGAFDRDELGGGCRQGPTQCHRYHGRNVVLRIRRELDGDG